MSPRNRGMVDAILASVRRQHPQVKAERREDIPSGLLKQIKADAVMAERRRAMAPNLLARAFKALR
jgi:hypothetical protein